MNKLSSWIKRCEEEHENGCPHPKSPFMPRRLIEVRDSDNVDCLRLRTSDQLEPSAYIPLSYCWGGDQPIKTTTTQISNWMKDIPYHQLPPTLQDAVTVCRHLQVRFLWVDAICIVQDDDIDKAQQIAQMPIIYKNGYLTIIAASASSASQGFLRGRTAPQAGMLAFDLPYHCPDGQVGTVTLYQLDRVSDPVDARAWTLQERLLSPRAVEFSSHQVRWVCLQAAGKPGWNDGWLVKPKAGSSHLDFLPRGVYSRVFGVPLDRDRRITGNFKPGSKTEWYSLVKVYTLRSLTKPEDRILALSGLAKEYSALLEDTYLAGLWRNSLLNELLWFVDGAKQPAPTAFQGPSWSWTSVNGPIGFKERHRSDSLPKHAHVAEIVDCSPMLVEEGALFGAVEEVASSLVLKARLLPALLSPSKPSSNRPGSDKTEDTAILMSMSDRTSVQTVKVNLDTSEFRERHPGFADFTTPVTLLELHSYFLPGGQQWRVKGLVLRGEAVTGGLRAAALQRRLVEKVTPQTLQSASGKGMPRRAAATPDPNDGNCYSPAQVGMLRYQFRRQIGPEVDLWSDDQIRSCATDKDKCRGLLATRREEATDKDKCRGLLATQREEEEDEQVFHRVGIFEVQKDYWHKKDYNQRAVGECDWFKYCVPREVTIL